MMECKTALVETGGDVEKAARRPAQEGARGRGQEGRPRGQRGPGRLLHPPRRQDRRAGRGELRDRLRRQDRRVPGARQATSRCTSRPPPAAAQYVAKEEVPAAVLEKEKEIYKAQAAAQGKPANVQRQDRRGQAQEVLRELLPARAALRQGRRS